MVKNLKRTLALMLSVIMIFSSTLMTLASDEGTIAGNEAENSAQIEETVAAEAETSTKAPEAEAATQQTQAESAAEAVETVKPEITEQPEDAAVRLNDEAVFSLETNGQVKSCQWQTAKTKDGAWTNLNRREYGSSETLKIRAISKYDKRFFRCIVTFKDGTTAKSDEARLTIVEETSYPAQSFGSVKDTKVVAPEGALPTGATMEANEVVDTEAVQSVIDDMDGVDGSVLNAVDISFYDGNAEIQPKETVKVTMNVGKDVNFEELTLVHIKANADELDKDNLATEIVDFTYDKEAGTITFDADSFSTYTVIDTVVILDSEGSFDFDTADYRVTVSYTKEAGIPYGTELTVSQIPFDSDEYWDYWTKSLEKINEDATWVEGSEVAPDTRKGIAAAAFFDISLMYDGKKFEPVVPLQVEINLKQGGLPLFEGQEVRIVHFADEKANGVDGTELIDDVNIGEEGALAGGMPDGVSVNSFVYEQTGFSVAGAITTDDLIDFDAAEYAGSYTDVNNMASRMLLAATRAAGDPTINAGKTVTDNDGDGIYELALSVNATSQQSSTTNVTKSNVVMVIDVSGSMGNEDSWIYYDTYTYDAATYNQFRYYSSSSSTNTRLYYGQYRTGGYTSQVRTGWYYGGNTYGGNVYNAYAYSGTVYAYETRLHATQRASCAVVDALLAKNENEDGITDIFEITVVKFANLNDTETVIKDSTNATAIKNAINGLTSGGGTNWEAALNLAKTEADYFKNTDPSRDTENPENISVIFLTDGFPTYYVNDNGTQGGSGYENGNNIATSYTEARPSARTLVSSGYTLYNIFAFGSDTTTYNNHTGFAYLRALTNYAYGTGNTDNYNETANTRQYAFNAKSTDDLIAAFETIINHITNSVGYAGVNLSDGVSLGTTSTSVAVNGTAKAETMRYTVKDASDKLSYTVKISSSGAATFTIYNADGTETTLTDNSPDTVTTTINGETYTSKVYSVTVGTGDDAKTYKMSPATINADTGMVQWDLAGLGILESGYTYTVAFDVWANQLAYDIAADLNNGLYADVDVALTAYNVTDPTERQHIKDAIVKNADGSYSLYTNYSQDVSYYPATSHTDDDGNVTWEYGNKATQELPQPDPIPLKGSLLPLAKVWESGLAQSELNEILWEDGVVGGTSKEYQITLYVWKADTEAALDTLINGGDTSKAYITKVLGWDSEEGKYIFEKDAAVAPGMMVNLDEAETLGFDISDTSKIRRFTNDEGTEFEYYVIENGHYYYVTESGSDLHFELETSLYHPMIVDGTLYNVFFGEGQTVEKMDPMYAVTATNYLKGGLNIDKVVSTTQISVTDGSINNVTEPMENGVKSTTDEFTYEIKIWKTDDAGNKTAVYTFDDQIDTSGSTPKTISGSIGYRIFSEPSLNDGKIVYGGQVRGAILTEDSQYKDLANGIYATIANKETTITLTMPANGEIRLVNLPSGTQYTVREIVDSAGSYTYAATKSQEITEDGTTDGTVTTANTVSGAITGNKASLETYYNWAANFYVYHSKDNTIEKISFADERVEGTYDAKNGYTYTFDINAEIKPESLYGGYYKAYGGQANTASDQAGKDAAIRALTYDSSWATDADGAVPYTGINAKIGGTNVWDMAGNAYTTDKGTEMHPVADGVYYLKEVPTYYLLNYHQINYMKESGELKALYLISAVDDLNYKATGFTLTKGNQDATKVVKSLTFNNYSTGKSVTLKANTVFKAKGITGTGSENNYLTYYDATSSDYFAPGTFTVRPYWETPDGITVNGISTRTITIKDMTKSGITKSDE